MQALLVDDDPSLRMLLRRLLTREFKFECIEADNGVAALEVLASQSVDVMALDLRMPLMGGAEVLQAVRRSEAHRDLPVVVVSTMDDEEAVRRVVELGISDYLLKPFNAAIVQSRMRALLQSGQIGNQRRTVRIAPTSTVLVVDGNEGYATQLAGVLREHCAVHVCSSGIRAFKQALQHPTYAAILVGDDLGLLGPDMLLERLRGESLTRFIPVVGMGVTHGEHARYDAVLPRSFLPDVTREALAGLLGVPLTPRVYLRPNSVLDLELQRAVGQAVGLVSPVNLRPTAAAAALSAARWGIAAVELAATHFALDVQVLASMPDARALVAARDDRGLHAVGEDQAVALLGDIAAIAAARTAVVLEGLGYPVSAGSCRTRTVTHGGGGLPGAGRAAHVTSRLLDEECNLSVATRLVWLETANADTVRAAAPAWPASTV